MLLVVLSEINCLHVLQAKGVYPDRFYTDIGKFTRDTVYFRDATVIIIFAGNCHFNKRHTISMAKDITRRAETDVDTGIKHVYVVSDMTIAGLRSYYKYEGTIDRVSIMHGWNNVQSGVDIWKKLKTPKVETKVYLSAYDRGDAEDMIKGYISRDGSDREDAYKNLIQVPDLRKLLGLA